MSDFLKALLIAALWSAAPAWSAPQTEARAALTRLEAAIAALDQADAAEDRIAALTQTILAMEDGLAAMRSSQRQVAQHEAQLAQGLSAENQRLVPLLQLMQRIGDPAQPAGLIHPGGALGAARAQNLLDAITPQLAQTSQRLSAEMDDLHILRALQQQAVQRMQDGAEAVQKARADLVQAMADRSQLPRRFVVDPIRAAVLIASTETLDGFASGLSQITAPVDGASAAPAPPAAWPAGDLPLPALARIVTPGSVDSERPGLWLSVPPAALITAPVVATIRFAGPLFDLGNVVILEPRPHSLLIFAGLDTILTTAGETVLPGSPLGFMADLSEKNAAKRSTDGDGTGTLSTDALYIEVRQDDKPVDPAIWFQTDKDG